MKNTLRNITYCLSIVAMVSGVGTAYAAPSDCANSYFADQRPDVNNPKLSSSAKELCSDYYAVWYSGIARTPLWSAEFLSQGRIEKSYNGTRTEDFRPDMRLPSDWRATLADYKKSGFDRGHMSPSADMPGPAAVSSSFLLSNMVPQDPQLNRNLWAAIEKSVRARAKYQPLYVITGPLFLGEKIDRINGRVLVPTHIFKLLYDPKDNTAGAYLVENAPNKRHVEVTLEELEQKAGVKFLPGASNVKVMKIPRPRYPAD